MKKSVAIIGGGAAGLMLAACLDSNVFNVSIYEKNKSFGRKFLVAGKGGFNLTHSEPISDLILKYQPSGFLDAGLLYFNNEDFRKWLEGIGIPTFIGSSRRIYPIKGIKPIEILNKVIDVLKKNQVSFNFEHNWEGWDTNNNLIFNSQEVVCADYVVYALGGSSWKVTGSDGTWLDTFKEKEIQTIPFQASNCAFSVLWPPGFIEKHSGHPLKNIALTCTGNQQKGELVITDFGLEGNAIYALSSEIQNEINSLGKSMAYLDLKPQLSTQEILIKLERSQKKMTQTLAETLKLSRSKIDLIKSKLSKEEFLDNRILANTIKSCEIMLTASDQIDRAISTTGGISLDQVDAHFMLEKMPNHFCIGEMLDWNAPTGGYLLQACFSMGVYLANHLNESGRYD